MPKAKKEKKKEVKKKMTFADVRTERDVEKLLYQTVMAYSTDEFQINLENKTMPTYIYKLSAKKDEREVDSIGYGKDDPDGAYITAMGELCRKIETDALVNAG